MKRVLADYWSVVSDREIRRHLIISVVVFLVSKVFVYFYQDYAKETGGVLAPDLLLDRLPLVNVGAIFFGGMALLMLIPIALCLFNPWRIPFILEVSAVFFSVRSFFMVLTHLSPPSIEYYNYIGHIQHIRYTVFTLSSGYDMFFSGHTGYPYLLSLLTWARPFLRNSLIGLSVLMGAVVLFGHLHYSIDVFAAYFISYGIFQISKRLFIKEFTLYHTERIT